jgi:hypothetical protein
LDQVTVTTASTPSTPSTPSAMVSCPGNVRGPSSVVGL